MNYVLGSTNQEVKRLDIQARIFEKETLQTLRLAGIKKGMRCLDLGCGTGTTSLLLGYLVGKSGEVIGLDVNQERIRICKRRVARKGINNVKFVLAGVYDTKFKDSSFDFVFSRFLFQHLTDPQRALKEMLRITRKGGIVATEEFVHGSWLSYPYDPDVERLTQSYIKLAQLAGSDPFIARDLYKFFAKVGLNPSVGAYFVCVPMNDISVNKISILMAEILKENLLKNRIMSRIQFQKMCKELRKYTKRQDFPLLYALTFRVWAKKQ